MVKSWWAHIVAAIIGIARIAYDLWGADMIAFISPEIARIILLGLFIALCLYASVKPQLELNKLKNAQPRLYATNTYPEKTTFYVFAPDTYEEDDERRRKHAMRSTSAYPESTFVRGVGTLRDEEDHEMIIVNIKNEIAVGQIGIKAYTSALVEFYNEAGKKIINEDFEGRWWDERESGLMAQDGSTKHLKTTPIAPGTVSKLSLASKIINANLIYAYNSESHNSECLRKKKYKLGRGIYYAQILLAIDNYISPDPIWVKIWSNKNKQLKCKIEIPEWSTNVRHKK